MPFKGKLINQTWENGKKNPVILGPILASRIFSWVLPVLDEKAIIIFNFMKKFWPKLHKMAKKLILDQI